MGRFAKLCHDFYERRRISKAIYNTIIYSFITVVLLSVVTILMAAWLAKNTKIHNLAQTMVFTPHIASLVSISILWIAMLNQTVLSTKFWQSLASRSGLVVAGKYFALFGFAGYGLEKTSVIILIIISGLQASPLMSMKPPNSTKHRKCGLSSALPFRSLRQPCLLSLLPNLSIPLRCLPRLKL